MRTNIDIDDELMQEAMAAANATTKKAAVEEALRFFVQIKRQTAILKWRGKIAWRGPDDDWFASDEEIFEKRRQERLAVEADEILSTAATQELAVTGSPSKR